MIIDKMTLTIEERLVRMGKNSNITTNARIVMMYFK